ncbi:MAG: V-type ATP synthase subunit A [Deltaproteobacteria bacterium]|nr:V-type ATP synthase subunit A [Deltaproteobacteria bacterium]
MNVEDGKLITVFGNLVTAWVSHFAMLNSVAYCERPDGVKLLSEVVRIRGNEVDLQVFEDTRGLRVGCRVHFTREMLSVSLGPGLLGQVFDGLQNPLPQLAKQAGNFLTCGTYIEALPSKRKWHFSPTAAVGAKLSAGETVGIVDEGIFKHHIMIPFQMMGEWTLSQLAKEGEFTTQDEIGMLENRAGVRHPLSLQQKWPVKVPLAIGKERLLPFEPLVTRVRILDTLFPIVKGGTYCIPGPFGAGKTVLQQITSRHAEIDVVVVAACGERAGEVVELLREFPELTDPRTGSSLMERTVIICNTSSMPVAAREASVYTAVTIAEYYRQMALNVLLLADSTSRWAQALRELSGRLEEIPGEEAFPAYLESRIANFYERAGCLKLKDGRVGSVTIGGTVSPAGGSFEEPVTQGTLKVVGAFHGLSRARSDARKFPAIDPLLSWSTYQGIIENSKTATAMALLKKGDEIRQMMAVVGEEGTSTADFVTMLKADLFDSVYLQQNAFEVVDSSSQRERQQTVFDVLLTFIRTPLRVDDKAQARQAIFEAMDLFRHWNHQPFGSDEFAAAMRDVDAFIERQHSVEAMDA